MDLPDAVALSMLPGSARQILAAALHEARRAAAGSASPGALSLDTVLGRLGRNRRVPPVAVRALREQAAQALARARALGLELIGWGDGRYPPYLAAIADPPPVLWMRGDASALAAPAVAIVGSRAASPYALDVAARLAADLAARGATIVSGLARGVDAAAHRGALAASGGRTVAVLGSGADVIYPPEHAALARTIATRGALVSELPPGTPPLPEHFPLRNRIISGLSQAVVVVEASDRSGSLITARAALDQGREVMAVPGNVLSGRNRGSHALLKDGAKLVEDADDILEELRLPARPGGAGAERGNCLPDDELVRGLRAGEAHDLDELVAASGLDATAVLSRLLELELQGIVARADGGRFRLVARKMVT